MGWTTVILAPNPSWEGAFKDRSEQKRTVDRRGRQFGPRMPLVSSLLKTFPWALDCRTLTRKPGWAGRGLHSIGRSWEGQDGKEGQLLALFQSLGVGAAFWHNLQDLLGGRRRSWGCRIFLELGFFPFEERP